MRFMSNHKNNYVVMCSIIARKPYSQCIDESANSAKKCLSTIQTCKDSIMGVRVRRNFLIAANTKIRYFTSKENSRQIRFKCTHFLIK